MAERLERKPMRSTVAMKIYSVIFFFLLLAINVYLDRSILNEVIATWLYMVIPSDLDTVINKFNK